MLAFTATVWSTALVAQSTPGQAKPAAAAKNSLSKAPETQEFVRSLRGIEAKVSSGMNHDDYSRAVGELAAAGAGLDELLESRKDKVLRADLAKVLDRYQPAKDLWSACIQSPEDCPNGAIFLEPAVPSVPATFARRLLLQYPEMKKSSGEGGALIQPYYGPENWASMRKLLSAIWSDAADRGKALRAALR